MTDGTHAQQEGASPAEVWERRRWETVEALVSRERLEESVEEGEVESTDVTFALEVVELADLEGERASVLFVGVLAAAVARRRGSVRFDLDGGGTSGLARRLAALLPGLFADADEAERIAGALPDLLRSEAVEPLVGGAGTYRPLIVDGGHLYRHRDWVEEGRLADAVAERIEPEWFGDAWPEDAKWSRGEVEAAIEEVVAAFDPAPTPEQQYAVATAATSPLSVVTGGPGTGKTSLVVTLLRVVVALGVEPDRIALAAPTGKAADRLGEAVDEQLAGETPTADAGDGQLTLAGVDEPSRDSPEGRDRWIGSELEEPATIHRLLGYSERRREFHYDEYRPLPFDIVIVDEASMVDLELMDRLVAAVDASAKLVLVGDADQLPAVGSGAVFRDLVPQQVCTATPRRGLLEEERAGTQSDEPLAAQSMMLTRNFRMRADDPAGANVSSVARAVREGGEDLRFVEGGERETSEPEVARRESFVDLAFRGAEILSGDRDDWVEPWYDGPIAGEVLGAADWRDAFRFGPEGPTGSAGERLDELFGAFEQYQLLGVTRRRRRGVDVLDARLHRQHVRRHGLSMQAEFVVGEPVMMTRNDYERELFNGDRGVILPVRDVESGTVGPRAIFPGRDGYRALALGPLAPHLDRAWTVTVHKAQGSEYDSVGVVLPTESIPLATRELLYTGITRARRSVAFFGDSDLVVDAAQRVDERNTGLVERLRERVRPPGST